MKITTDEKIEIYDGHGNLRMVLEKNEFGGSMAVFYGSIKEEGAEVKIDPEKSKFVSQVLDELGFGKDVDFVETVCRMAEKIANLYYEVAQLKVKN